MANPFTDRAVVNNDPKIVRFFIAYQPILPRFRCSPRQYRAVHLQVEVVLI